MDPEATFLRVHARLSGMLSQLLTPRIRLALEYIYLVTACALFAVLVVMHTNFVQQPGCSNEFSGIEFSEAQLVHIKIVSGDLWAAKSVVTGKDYQNIQPSTKNAIIPEVDGDKLMIPTSKFWSSWINSGGRRNKLIKPWKVDKDSQPESTPDDNINRIQPGTDFMTSAEGSVQHPVSVVDSLKSMAFQLFRKNYMRGVKLWNNCRQLVGSTLLLLYRSSWTDLKDIVSTLQIPRIEHVSSKIVEWFDRRSKASEPAYLYAVEKGYFLLSEGARVAHGIQTINVTISAQNQCLGNRWQRLLINSFVGYDTIITNSLLSYPGHGYLYNFQTKEFNDLSSGHEPVAGPTRFGDYFATKCGVLIMSLFVFFTTTMSVSFTLRETQSRMLKFTVQLQHHARHQLPTFQLIFVHVIESLVFVPIMIGILFFLFEFYDDQLLAFLVLILVWLCELFTMISVRTSISMQFFPRFFLLYFLVFHIYFFSYKYGFSYLAFSTTAAFMQHLILYFWNRFEVPALQRFIRNRGQLQQQANVHFTSSTIYASTLHIARVNVADSNLANNNLGTAQELRAEHSIPGSGIGGLTETSSTAQDAALAGNSEEIGHAAQFQHPNPQRATNAPGVAHSVNPLGSLLLRLLGGGASDGIVSFFSMFRDVREQPQGYANLPQNENNPVT